MANTPSAKKAIRVSQRRSQHNLKVRSAVKTSQKEVLSKLAEGSQDVQEAVRHTISMLDKALAKGILHKNKAARKKSRLQKKLNLLLAGKKV